jgi:DNA-binding NarL/FixJ family response regulator
MEDKRSVLTKREKEILGFLAKGFSCPEIATILQISKTTVSLHANRILQKSGKNSRMKALLYFSKD